MARISQEPAPRTRGGYAKRHRTQALILDAALAEASERGLHRASVSGIAARANTAVGNLNYHFGSRAELLRAMMRRLMADFYATLAASEDQREEHVGDLDIFRDEAIAYGCRLAAAGVPLELHVHPGCPHAFEGLAPDAAVSRRAIADRVRRLSAL